MNRKITRAVSRHEREVAEFDAETRFRLRAKRGHGKIERGLALLKKAASK